MHARSPTPPTDFSTFFETATGFRPFPFQRAFAEAERLPALVSVPTGLGKTAMAVLGWLWRRRFAPHAVRAATPRRLVYCLPMRSLVEQTHDNAVRWLHALGLLSGRATFDEREQRVDYDPWAGDGEGVPVFMLMGGEVERDWDRLPDRDTILVGTQDLLLSRALMRGYAVRRFRWPVQFGLLHTDTLWVLDEVQLMGSGLATTAQFQALRRIFGARRSASVWMSATLRPEWLHTIDFDEERDAPERLSLGSADRAEPTVRARESAAKPLDRAPKLGTAAAGEIASWLLREHRSGTLTLVVRNTVRQATELHRALEKAIKKHSDTPPRLVLLHGRFRPGDRRRALDALLAPPGRAGTLAVCTQVVEAGVDVSADLLVTDPAPWSSLVQRFGRCNRRGEQPHARVLWFDTEQKIPRKLAGPYPMDAVQAGLNRLHALTSAAPTNLPPVDADHGTGAVLRRIDLIDLFDTSPDLSGRDIDVSPYIREGADHHVFVFWRTLGTDGPSADEPAPRRDELCPVPAGAVRDRLKEGKGKGSRERTRFWRWDIHERQWTLVEELHEVVPGMTLLAPADQGDYDPTRGWLERPDKRNPVPVLPPQEQPDVEESAGGDPLSRTGRWVSLADHTDRVVAAVEALTAELRDLLTDEERDALRIAARWHDRGKAHPVFQEALVDAPAGGPWAKSAGRMKRYRRRGFRHELASALAMLDAGLPDLAAWLAAAHHGKVRLVLRAWPGEEPPGDEPPDGTTPEVPRRFACGVVEGDELPATDLGGGVTAPGVRLRLSYMEIGLDPVTGPSWTDRALALRDRLGPFRLAFLEALLRVADWRGSVEPAATSPEASHAR